MAPRIVAPLTGSVTAGTWVTGQQITVAAMPNGYMQYNYLLPSGYSTAFSYPVLFYGHENDEGMNGSVYPANGANLINQTVINGTFNTVAFRTNYPCIVVVPQCDQTLDLSGSDGNANFGGYNDTANSGGNEQGVNAVLSFMVANFSADVTRLYCTGDSLGAIGTLAWLIDNNTTNGVNKYWAAGFGFSDQIYRPAVPNSNTVYFQSMTSVPYLAISTPNDNNQQIYDQAGWTYYTGNANYPVQSTYDSGGVAAIRAGSSSFYYIYTTTGVPWDTFRQLNADGGDGTAIYSWLFSQIATQSSFTKTYSQTITGLTTGTTYDFQVYAFNASGSGPASAPAVVVATAGSLVPGAPSALAASSISATSFLLTFAPPTTGSAATSYQVQYKLTSAQTWTNFATPLPASVQVIVIGAGGSIVDTSGNTWTITSGAQCAINGVTVANTSAVLLLALVQGVMWAENTSNNWYSFTNAGVNTGGPLPNPIAGFNQVVTTTTGMVVDTLNQAWTITATGGLALNGTMIAGTSGVVLVCLVGGVVWCENTSNLWYSWTSTGGLSVDGTSTSPLATISQAITGLTVSTTYDVEVYASNATGNGPVSSQFVVTTSAVNANFTISNGKLLTPNGASFVCRGFNLNDSQMGLGTAVLTQFPGTNFIRLNCYSYQAPSAYQPFITAMSAAGVVVELEDHQNSTGSDAGGGSGQIFSGSLLTNSLNWYSALASAYAGNPLVWFGTNNEPSDIDPSSGNPNDALLASWEGQQIAAVRNAGNNNIVLVCLGDEQGSEPGINSGLTPSVYAAYHNIMWDYHQYPAGYFNNAGGTVAQFQSAISQKLAYASTMPSADGPMPSVCMEYGDSQDSQTQDTDWQNFCTALFNLSTNSGTGTTSVGANTIGTCAGCACWHWGDEDGSGYDNMSSSNSGTGGTLTALGLVVQAFCAGGTPA